MTTMCERYSAANICSPLPLSDTNRTDPPKAGELFREAAVTLAVPLAFALAVSVLLPLAGLAGQ